MTDVRCRNPHMGYETAARVAREAIVEGTPVREIVLRDKLLSREQLVAILDPFEMTSPGIAGVKPEKQEHVWKDQDEDER
jgi:aspartate ammonia-lyase